MGLAFLWLGRLKSAFAPSRGQLKVSDVVFRGHTARRLFICADCTRAEQLKYAPGACCVVDCAPSSLYCPVLYSHSLARSLAHCNFCKLSLMMLKSSSARIRTTRLIQPGCMKTKVVVCCVKGKHNPGEAAGY